jgi:membrane protease YdiL (CAAX protease family)
MTSRDTSPIRSVAAFFVGAIALSWSCWLLVVAADRGLITMPGGWRESLVIVGTFGPLFSAFAMAAKVSGVQGVRALAWQAFRWRVHIKWYAAALLIPALVRFAVLGLHILKGGTFPGLGDGDRWLAVPSTFALVLLLGGPLGEEFGWRGYSQPRLQNRLGILASSLIVGVGSAAWHLPLFLIPTTPQSHIPLALFLVRTVALSVISGWIWNRGGRGLFLILLFHASLNTWPNTLFILEAQGTLGPYISTTILYVGWAVVLVLMNQLTPERSAVRPRAESSRAAA